jgi:hypothetical protein
VFAGIKTLFDRVIGGRPTVDFALSEGGVVLRINNGRSETIIIHAIDSAPPLLALATGNEIIDLVEAMVGSDGKARIVLNAGERYEFSVICKAHSKLRSPSRRSR